MADKNNVVIIKKKKKAGHGGHHGGAWKIAYADFVTAMMAFFLMMWLLNMSSPEKRARLALYFKYFSLFEESGISFMGKSSEVFSQAGQGLGRMDDSQGEQGGEEVPPDQIKNKMAEAVRSILGEQLGQQVLFQLEDGGIRIQIVDVEGRSMFALGKPDLTGTAKKILGVIAEQVKDLPYRFTVEGHTDSYGFEGKNGYTNWELSADRANAARRALVEHGIKPSRFDKVVGYADALPFIRDNPVDPRNRRISIFLANPAPELAPAVEDVLRAISRKDHGEKPGLPEVMPASPASKTEPDTKGDPMREFLDLRIRDTMEQ